MEKNWLKSPSALCNPNIFLKKLSYVRFWWTVSQTSDFSLVSEWKILATQNVRVENYPFLFLSVIFSPNEKFLERWLLTVRNSSHWSDVWLQASYRSWRRIISLADFNRLEVADTTSSLTLAYIVSIGEPSTLRSLAGLSPTVWTGLFFIRSFSCNRLVCGRCLCDCNHSIDRKACKNSRRPRSAGSRRHYL